MPEGLEDVVFGGRRERPTLAMPGLGGISDETRPRFRMPETALSKISVGTTPTELAFPRPERGEDFGNMFLDLLALPEIAFFDRSVRGAFYAIAKDEGIEGVLKRFIAGSPFAAGIEFFTGRDVHENVTSEEVLKAMGVENPGFLGNLLFSIAASPSTYVGLGGLTKLGKATRAGQIYMTASKLPEIAEGIQAVKRGAETLRFGTKAAIEASGGTVGERLALQALSLKEQAAIGARSVSFGIGNWQLFLPKNITVPIYNGAEVLWGGLKRTKIATAARELISNAPVIGKGFSSANSETIALSNVADDIVKNEVFEIQGLGSAFNEMLERGVGSSIRELPEELKPFVSLSTELGLKGIDATLSPENVTATLGARIGKVFGLADPKKTAAIATDLQRKMLAGVVDDEASIRFANDAVKKVLYVSGLTDDMSRAAVAYERILELNPGIRESYAEASDALRTLAIPEGMPKTRDEFAALAADYSLDAETRKKISAYLDKRDSIIAKNAKVEESAQRAAKKLGLFAEEFRGKRAIGTVDNGFSQALPKVELTNENLIGVKSWERFTKNDPTNIPESINARARDGLTREQAVNLIKETRDLGVTGTSRGIPKNIDRLEKAVMEFFDRAEASIGDGAVLMRDGSVGLGEAVADGVEGIAKGFAELGPGARETLSHTAQGYRTLVERIGADIRQGSEFADVLKRVGGSAIDPKARESLRKTAEKTTKILTKAGADIGKAPAELKFIYDSQQKAANAVTYSDLLAASVTAVDDLNRFILAAENAAGVTTAFTEGYFAHVVTQEGRNFINTLSKQAGLDESAMGLEFFTHEREFAGWTIGEMNAVARQMGFKGTSDTPSKLMNELGEFVSGQFGKVDPQWLEKLRKLDPSAAAVFEADVMSTMQRRLHASAATISKANFHRQLFSLHAEGGLAGRKWTVGGLDTREALSKQLTQAVADGYVVVDPSDILHPRSLLPREIIAESSLMRAQGITDDARGVLYDETLAIDEAVKNARRIPEIDPKLSLREGQNLVAIDREVYNEVLEAHAKMTAPLYMGGVMRFMHKATNFWKAWTLTPIPAFHARNFVGDLFLAGLGGMGPVGGFKAMKDAARLIRSGAGYGKGLLDYSVDVGDKMITGAEALSMMKRFGVIGHGAHVMDTMGVAEMSTWQKIDAGVATWIPFLGGKRNKILEAGNAVADAQSSVVRAGFFLDRLRKGMDPHQAARETKKYLLDYTSNLLTHTERSSIKLAIPFWTYMRRSVPIVFEHLVTQTQKFATMEKFIQSYTGRDEELAAAKNLPDELLPDFVEEMYGIPYKIDAEGNPQFFLLKSWLPGGDVAELADAIRGVTTGEKPKSALNGVLARINPFAKVPVEMMSNYSFFTGKPISRFEGQEQEVFGEPFSARAAYLLRQIRLVNELDKLNPGVADRTGELGARGEADDVDRWMGFLAGGKPTSVNVTTERSKSEYEIEKSLREASGEIRRLMKNPNTINRKEQIEALQEKRKELYKQMMRTNSEFAEFRKAIGIK